LLMTDNWNQRDCNDSGSDTANRSLSSSQSLVVWASPGKKGMRKNVIGSSIRLRVQPIEHLSRPARF
jgi:hypothetical protein